MRESRDVFHLAIPVYDLDESQEFYVGALGCKLARRYADRITLDFFGDQLVCHLVDRPVEKPERLTLYPRHFGVTFRDGRDFDALHSLCACSARSSSSPMSRSASREWSRHIGPSCCATPRTTSSNSSTTSIPE